CWRPPGHCCDWRAQLALLSTTISTLGLSTVFSSSTEKMSMSSLTELKVASASTRLSENVTRRVRDVVMTSPQVPEPPPLPPKQNVSAVPVSTSTPTPSIKDTLAPV